LIKSHLPLAQGTPFASINDAALNRTTANQLSRLNKTADNIKTAVGIKDWQGKGSNNWVVSGRFTDTGMPLLANDPHLQLNSPGVWYLAELKGPHLHAIGATLPGSPMVVIGHNDSIAWGVTNVNPDNQDLYFEPKNAKMNALQEIIKIKNAPDYVLNIKISAHGPIISGLADAAITNQPIAIKWPTLMPGDTTVQSFVKINYAKNWPEFKSALKDFVAPSQNFVYADVYGNIGYYLPGRIPVRPQHCDLRLPIEPNQRCEWGKYIPFDQLPHVFNPAKGYIASANNETMPASYFYSRYFPNEFPGFRAKRIVNLIASMIKEHHPISKNDFKKMQLDTQNNQWDEIGSVFLGTKPLDALSKKALAQLKKWGGEMSMDSAGAAIFGAWYEALIQLLPPAPSELNFEDDKPLFLMSQLKTNGKYCRVNGAKNCDELLSSTLQQTTQKLAALYKTDNLKKWRWGDVHKISFTEVAVGLAKPIGWIWNRTISIPGGDSTLNMGAYDQNFHVMIAPSYRQIVDLKNLNQSLYIAPPGQVDNPFSHHEDDLILPWRNGKYLPMSSDANAWGKVKKLALLPF
jgi:penicillin amidase